MFDALLRLCAGFAGAILAVIVAGIAANVVLRNLFSAPMRGLLDMVEYGLLLVTLLGAPWVLSRNAHVTVDLVTGALPERAAMVAARIVACLGCAVSLVMVWYGARAMLASLARGSMIRTAFDTPEWIVLAVLPLAFTLIAAEFLRQALHPRTGQGEQAGL